MNAFAGLLDKSDVLKKGELSVLQVNMGNLCNQRCGYCHVDASPDGNKVMNRRVVENILGFLARHPGLVLDITGGAPELNPNFDYLIVNARPLVKEIIVYSNLTVFFENGKEYLPQFFKQHNIHLIVSLPCFKEKNVDAQRGAGVFDKSIKALRLLNETGYSKLDGLTLDIICNPLGAYLPPPQTNMEKEYKLRLKEEHGVEFNRLITITNVPIKRFREYLDSHGEYDNYLNLLKDNFNPGTLDKIMCREFLSVGFNGKLYDCDFNQSLGWALKDKDGDFLTIDRLSLEDLEQRDIMVGEHCLSCTAGYGSSCQGALIEKSNIKNQISKMDYCSTTIQSIKSYYGKVLKSTKDLKTSACCSAEDISSEHKQILAKIHPEVLEKFYGCGSPIPSLLEGCRVLDLGCGTGKDVYTVSALVGENGSVVGVDITEEQLAVAKKHICYHTEKFGYLKPNVEFKKGYIENLKEIGIEDNSVDVVISNCVINLSADKHAVFSEIFRILKSGGELYFSDIFTGRRMPKELQADEVLYGECLGGALYIEDFRRILRDIGCLDYRVVSRRKIALNNPEIEAKAGGIDFYSMTIRVFKLDDLEDICEDYGQTAVYSGGIQGYPHSFMLDDHHIFIVNKPMLVCGNTASMLQKSRYAKHFKIEGDRTIHFGPFDCTPVSVLAGNDDMGGGCC